MAIRQVIQTTEADILKKKSREVTEINGRIQTLIDDMLDTIVEQNGAGLAAPQVSVLKRVIIVDFGVGDYRPLINPEIIEREGEQISVEGCLSICGRSFEVKRPMTVKVKALDRNGNKILVEGKGSIACRLCHEIDHLDGITIEDVGKELFQD